MTDKQIIDKLKNDVACKENIINHLAEHNIKLQDQLKAKEQECEELNKEIHNLNSTINFIKVTEHSAINKYNKLKQTLIEIKEIADLSIAHFDIDYLKQAINEILQKCEVLDVR